MAILRYSNIAAERNYSSVREFIQEAKILCQTYTFADFKEEMEKWMAGIKAPLSYLLSGRDEETDNKKTPFFIYCLFWTDGPKKLDWILSQVPKSEIKDSLEVFDPWQGKKVYEELLKFPELKAVYEKHGMIFTKLQGFGHKTESFAWNGFQVLNAGFKNDSMKKTLEEMEPTVEILKKKGFGKVLYGPLIFVSSPLKGQVLNQFQQKYIDVSAGGYYDIPQDNIVVKSYYDRKDNVHANIVTHELGHRHYYKILSSSQRQQWQAHFKNRGLYVENENVDELLALVDSCIPDLVDPLSGIKYKDFTKANWTKFTVKLKSNSYLKEVFDFIVLSDAINRGKSDKNIKTLRREWFKNFINEDALGGLWWCSKHVLQLAQALKDKTFTEEVRIPSRSFNPKQDIAENFETEGSDPRLASVWEAYDFCREHLPKWNWGLDYWRGKTIIIPHSSSEYGQNNESEDYAEAFEFFMHNREMPEDIYREFVRINNVKMGSKKKKILALSKLKGK